MDLRKSPLWQLHNELGARFVEFGGWEMPLSYASGTVQEHLTCRNSCVWFDVSHLGTVRVEGDDAFGLLQRTLTNDLEKIKPGRAQYTHLLDENGFVRDDIIVWWLDDGVFDVMPNASNTSNVQEVVEGTDMTATRAVIAIQGPHAREALESISSAAANVGRFCVTEFSFENESCYVAGTGYTGEDGVECSVPAEIAESFARALCDRDIVPAGLGARDTLRLEAGLPLHGHELGDGITPLQANLDWVVGWNKDEFIGKDALMEEKSRGVSRKLYGLVSDTRRPLREHCVVSTEEREIGVTTSGNISPVLEKGIAFALLPPRMNIGDQVHIDLRGSDVEAAVTPTPFVKRRNT